MLHNSASEQLLLKMIDLYPTLGILLMWLTYAYAPYCLMPWLYSSLVPP